MSTCGSCNVAVTEGHVLRGSYRHVGEVARERLPPAGMLPIMLGYRYLGKVEEAESSAPWRRASGAIICSPLDEIDRFDKLFTIMDSSLFLFQFRLSPWDACVELNFQNLALLPNQFHAVCTRDLLGLQTSASPANFQALFMLAQNL